MIIHLLRGYDDSRVCSVYRGRSCRVIELSEYTKKRLNKLLTSCRNVCDSSMTVIEEDWESILRKTQNKSNKTFAQEQRALVTPKIRFEVLKRDNFTCQYCGAHGEGVVI